MGEKKQKRKKKKKKKKKKTRVCVEAVLESGFVIHGGTSCGPKQTPFLASQNITGWGNEHSDLGRM